MYIIRLDDASDYMNREKWNAVDNILDQFALCPIVGIIPHNEDQGMVTKYDRDADFWHVALAWQAKGWKIALHGYNHVYITANGGVNPVNNRSEFAGLPIAEQKEKIKNGYRILIEKGLKPEIFFAPSHTYDLNTIEALKEETDIRIISDTIASDIYYENGFYYIPQQTGKPRKLPFKLTTICLHPNTMNDDSLYELRRFIENNRRKFLSADSITLIKRKRTVFEMATRKAYFALRRIKKLI